MTAQQLKNSILQMAVQGKLVPQIPSDEPASVLLERIRAEKEKLIKAGKIKKEKNPSVIFRGSDNLPYEKTSKGIRCIADEIPFEIPDSWEWVCLEQICEYIQRGKSPKYSPIKKYPVIAQKCNQWSGFSIEKAQFIAPETIEAYSPERFLRDRDLLWNSTGLGTLGRMAIYKNELNPYGIAVADSHVTVIRLSALVLPEFFFLYFANPSVQSVIEEQADGTTKQKELSRNTVRSYWTPLPPLAEQKRIVAKIEELVPHLEEYSQAETRIKKLNTEFPELLKKSILQWAIQGKLVPQNPDDEPASVLLERIRAEKAKLVKAGKIKKDKVESVIFRRDNSHYEKLNGVERCIDDEIPFEIPASWEWVRLGALITLLSGQDFSPSEYNSHHIGIPYITGASNIENGVILINRWTDSPHNIALCGDLLIVCKGAGVGKMAILDLTKVHIARQIMAIRGYNLISNKYLMLFLTAQVNKIRAKMNGLIPGIDRNVMLNFLTPLPPFAEQKRIVAEIEKVLSLQQTMRR